MKIYGKNGIEKAEIGKFQYSGTFMGESFLSFDMNSPSPIDFRIGDWCEYRGERYELNYTPTKVKQSTPQSTGNAFQYKGVKFNSLADELTRCDFLDVVLSDNDIHFTSLPNFSFTGNAQDLANRIQANLNRIYTGEKAWTVTVETSFTSDHLFVQASNIEYMEALQLVNSLFKGNYVIRGRNVTIGTAGLSVENIFGYGKGNGLYTIEEQTDNDALIITRLRAYGSTRNMPNRYYNNLKGSDGHPLIPESQFVPNLMLPNFAENGGDAYIDSPNIDRFGVREATVFFDGSDPTLPDIYPSLEGMTAEDLKNAGVQTEAIGELDVIVSAGQISDDGIPPEEGKGEIQHTFTIDIKDIGFNIDDYRFPNETPQISMKTGACSARTFDISVCEAITGGYRLTLERTEDESLHLYFPYNRYNIGSGDKFVLLQIKMPDIYIRAAAQRLLAAARLYLNENDKSKKTYIPKIDKVFMARNPQLHDTIKEGDIFNFSDTDLGIDESVIIQSLTIKEGGEVPEYEITLFNDKIASTTVEKIQNAISLLASNIGITLEQAKSLFRTMINAWYPNWFNQTLHVDDDVRFRSISSPRFVSGMLGEGYNMNSNGEAEFESVRVRTYFECMDLIVNRLSAIEGDQLLTESDTIESIDDLGNRCYGLHLKSKWDGYFTAQAVNNVLKGIINTLAAGSGQYYTSWMRVNSVNAANNYIEVTLYPDDETPAGQNFPPCEMMKIARWGNQTDPQRQSCIYLSSTEERIARLTGVTKPIIDNSNYGATFGTLPEFLTSMGLPIVDGQDYVYARGLIVQDIIRIDYQGQPIAEVVDRGQWSATADYYAATLNSATNVYEVSDVWYKGCRYRCALTGTHTAPAWNNTDWGMVEGNPEFTVDFADTDYIFDPDRFNPTLTVIAKLHNQDVTSDILANDVVWTRYSEGADGNERAASDNIWALRHAGAGKSLSLTLDDIDVDSTGFPSKLIYTATVTLRDGMGNVAGTDNAIFEY